MKNKYFSMIVSALVLLSINLLSVKQAFACQCGPELICEAFSRAESVFIGKVEKIESYKDEIAYPKIKVVFSVEKTFKGKNEKLVSADFSQGDCGNVFSAGERYFVYKYKVTRICNRTDRLSVMSRDLEYAESLSESSPVFFIKGRLNDLSEDEINNTRVTIEKEQTKYDSNFDKYGNFNFKAVEKGIYRVKIRLPFDAQISITQDVEPFLPENMKMSKDVNQTTLEYEVEFKPNECDGKQFYIYRLNKRAGATSTDDTKLK
jgi:hypothetical protein